MRPEKLEALAGDTRIDLARCKMAAQHVLLDGEDVTAAIRTPEVSQAASQDRGRLRACGTCWWRSSGARARAAAW